MDYIGTAIVVAAIFAFLGLGWILAPLIHFSSDQRARHRTIDEASAQMNKTNKRS